MKYFLLLLMLSYTFQKECPYQLVWSDDFNGASLDTLSWNYDTGDKWYNNELQAYSKNNVYLENGNLVIEAKRENLLTKSYTSGRINSSGKRHFTYGIFEARMKFPKGKGFWPAFWLWPESYNVNSYKEIDIMEAIGDLPRTIFSTCWMGPESNLKMISKEFNMAVNYDEDYHIYSAEWTPGEIAFAVDGEIFHRCKSSDSSLWGFDNLSEAKFHIILNLAVGGDWPGSPTTSTIFPSKMYVDWVKVYQNKAISGTSSKIALETEACEGDYLAPHLKNGVNFLKSVGKVKTDTLDVLKLASKNECCEKCSKDEKCVGFKFGKNKCQLLSEEKKESLE